jgi:hypothetical protein
MHDSIINRPPMIGLANQSVILRIVSTALKLR